MIDIDKSITGIVAAYSKAVYAKDAAALIRLYHADVRVFDAWGIWSYEGAPAWQRAVEAWFTSLRDERVKVTFEELKTSTSQDSAVLSAIIGYTAVDAQGAQLRAMHNRLTWALKVSGHVLRIVHEHTSAPLGFDDQKAILQRPAGA